MIKLKDIIKEGVIEPLLESAYYKEDKLKSRKLVRLSQRLETKTIINDALKKVVIMKNQR